MGEYRLHVWAPTPGAVMPSVSLEAESTLHGAALALRHFKDLGYGIAAPAAHIDVTDSGGAKHMVLVEEVIDWLKDPKQAAFVQREELALLI